MTGVLGAQRVAVAPDQPQVVGVTERLDGGQVNGLPSVWAIMTAFVLGERAASSLVTSMLYWGTVTSTNTGTAPYWMAGVTVVGKPQATVMVVALPDLAVTQLGRLSAMKAIRLARNRC